MLGMVAAERAAIEATYDGTMTVTGYRRTNDGSETVLIPDQIWLENEPCALSMSGTPETDQTETAGEIAYTAVVFCSPDITIPPGSAITVTQYGKTTKLLYSGECAMYPTHQQITGKRVDRA